MRAVLAFALAVALAACAPAAKPAPSIEDLRAPPSAEAVASCQARGGAYEQVGRVGAWACVTAYADAGKACTHKSQCAGACLIEEGEFPPAGAPASGACQRTNVQFGCYATVENGLATQAICVD